MNKQLAQSILLSMLTIGLFTQSACMRIIIRHDTLTAEQHNDLAVAYLKENHLHASERELKAALKKDPRYWLACYNLGSLYLQQQKNKEALPILFRVIIANPSHADAYNNLAIAYLRLNDPLHAHYFLKLALINATTNQYLYYDTLSSIYEYTHDTFHACEALQTAIINSPGKKKEPFLFRYNALCKKVIM